MIPFVPAKFPKFRTKISLFVVWKMKRSHSCYCYKSKSTFYLRAIRIILFCNHVFMETCQNFISNKYIHHSKKSVLVSEFMSFDTSERILAFCFWINCKVGYLVLLENCRDTSDFSNTFCTVQICRCLSTLIGKLLTFICTAFCRIVNFYSI